MSPIVLSEIGGPPGPQGPFSARIFAGQALGRLPPTALLLLALVSVQASSALATFLFSSIGPAGTAFLSAGFAGAVLTLISPPRIGALGREAVVVVVLFGLADTGMVLPFFLALERIRGGEMGTVGAVVVDRPSVEPRPNIFQLYEDNIGLLSPILADELRDAETTYPADWIEDAFRVAVAQNVRKWRYIQAILERWATEGKGDGTRKQDSETKRRWFTDEEFDLYFEH